MLTIQMFFRRKIFQAEEFIAKPTRAAHSGYELTGDPARHETFAYDIFILFFLSLK